MSKPQPRGKIKPAPLLSFNKLVRQPTKKPVVRKASVSVLVERPRVVVLPEELFDVIFAWLSAVMTPDFEADFVIYKVMDFVWSCHWSHPIKCFGNACHSFRQRVQKLLRCPSLIRGTW